MWQTINNAHPLLVHRAVRTVKTAACMLFWRHLNAKGRNPLGELHCAPQKTCAWLHFLQ